MVYSGGGPIIGAIMECIVGGGGYNRVYSESCGGGGGCGMA